jgi:poly(3-hydroxybutyrate) depolymerase
MKSLHILGAVQCAVFLIFFENVFSQDLTFKNDIIYRESADWQNNIRKLKLDIIYPSERRLLPLIVFVHGGGFDANSTKEFSTPFCQKLAKCGFIVANVEYRTGVESSFVNIKTEISKAVYRAEQDQIAAARYLIHSASEYSIDTSRIFFAGESAGGVTSLFSAFVNQDDWDKLMPVLHNTLGAIDSSANISTEKIKIRGVINLLGGIADTALISEQELRKLPVLLFHSVDDSDIPYTFGSHPQAKYQLLQGSRDIADRYKNNNGCYELHYIYGAGHSYGFSADYLSNAISRFVSNVIDGKCSSSEIENKGNINLRFVDSDSAAQMNVENKTITLSPDVLQQYGGRYKGRQVIITISVEEDHLKAETAGQEVIELYPVKEDVFIEKKSNTQAIFTRDANGKIKEHKILLTKNLEFSYQKID